MIVDVLLSMVFFLKNKIEISMALKKSKPYTNYFFIKAIIYDTHCKQVLWFHFKNKPKNLS